MSRIAAIDPNQAQGKTAELLAQVQMMLGGTPNMFRTAAQAPAVLESLVALFGASARGTLRAKTRESIALTVAEANGCDYCLSAHTALAKGAGLSQDEAEEARAASSPDAKTHAILELAKTLVLCRGRIGGAALDDVRGAGVTDAEVLEVIAQVAMNIFTNYLNIVADTDIDFPVVRAGQPVERAA
jgi:uncharacterized peroxidase-related enzyme